MFHYVINLLPSPPRLCLRTTCWKIHHAQWIQCCKFCAAHQSSLAAGAGVIKSMANSIGPRNHYPWLDNGLSNWWCYTLFKKPGRIYSLGCCCSNLVMFFYRYTLWLRSSRKQHFFLDLFIGHCWSEFFCHLSQFRIPVSGFRIPNSRFRVPYSGFRVLGLP